ncbi:MAG TPA: cytochrome d ubiquinol oxidase subunit II, partial [Candidatus Deferrimicrobium sp.]|nr:cytochrome d ubiquinol oxidase subunit II [Candidatus Deferrimicrobium sp.]
MTNLLAWDFAFAVGSILAAFSQGVILGGLIQGITVVNGEFAGGPFDWATPFALMCGVGLVVGYALLGATWLIARVEGPLADWARRQAGALLAVVLLFIALVSLWTPYEFERIAERWFSTPNIYFLWPVPLLTAALGFIA